MSDVTLVAFMRMQFSTILCKDGACPVSTKEVTYRICRIAPCYICKNATHWIIKFYHLKCFLYFLPIFLSKNAKIPFNPLIASTPCVLQNNSPKNKTSDIQQLTISTWKNFAKISQKNDEKVKKK